MNDQVLIVGGGIGGLAAALAVSRAGRQACMIERAAAFAEIGAGVQLGPNVTRLLNDWGLSQALSAVAAFPEKLEVRHAGRGHLLGTLRLGEAMTQRYGAPYATLHRADLHRLLLQAVQQAGTTALYLACSVGGFVETADSVCVQTREGADLEGAVLVGADGLWSAVRAQLLGDAQPRLTGHLAYRALVPQQALPEELRTRNVTVWLGPRMHVVQYPVRSGEYLNIVAIVEGTAPDALHDWDHEANAASLALASGARCAALTELMEAIPAWRLWVVHDRAPMQGPKQQAQGRVALLGDAAHPMRPYLAQGAGMAIEDAAELGRVLTGGTLGDAADRLQRYAGNRWQRNARVQARAIRNGEIFHAAGLIAQARDAGLRILGERLLDVPWLYRGG